jgi:hypothetical protein
MNQANLAPSRSYFGGWKYDINNLKALKHFKQAAIIYEHILTKSPRALSLLFGDIELAAKQNDIQRVHKRLKAAFPLLTKTNKSYVYIPFIAFIVDSEQSFRTVITAIEAMNKSVRLEFNFTDLKSVIERQSLKRQYQIRLFMDYFKETIDLVTLKRQLNRYQGVSNNLSETSLNQKLEIVSVLN